MIYDFSADNIFEMAEQMERNGATFYRTSAEGTADPSVKKLLLKIAKMEEAHEITFAALRADLTDKEKEATIFDPAGESVLYLRSMVDTKVFFEKEIDVSSIEEVFKAAILAEKDAIVFYLGMKDLVPDTFGKDKIDMIIREEMGHIKILSNELIAFKK